MPSGMVAAHIWKMESEGRLPIHPQKSELQHRHRPLARPSTSQHDRVDCAAGGFPECLLELRTKSASVILPRADKRLLIYLILEIVRRAVARNVYL